MQTIINLFNLVLYQPLFNALILLYEYLPGRDFGVAIIVLTLLIRVILYPSMAQSLRSQKALSALQPKMQEIQSRYKNDLAKQSQAMLELYRKEKISPFSSLFPLLIQLPVLIALYRLFWKGLEAEQLTFLYGFVPNPGTIDPTFLNLLNLSQHAVILAVVAGVLQFFQGKMLMPQGTSQKSKFSDALQKQMLYFFPLLTVFILWKMPAAIGIYWVTTTLFSIVQQYLILKPQSKTMPAEGQKA